MSKRSRFADEELADNFAYNLRQCGKALGIKVKKPMLIDFNPRNKNWMDYYHNLSCFLCLRNDCIL